MKIKDLKKKLNAEMENSTPDVLNNVVTSSYIEKRSDANGAKRSETRRRRHAVMTAVSLSAIAAVVTVGIGTYIGVNRQIVPNATYAAVEIGTVEAVGSAEEENPEIAFTANSSGVIETVRAGNEEGEIVLSAVAVKLKGKKLEAGVTLFVNAAAKLGYIDVNATAAEAEAKITVKVAGVKKGEDIAANIENAVIKSLKEGGIYAFVNSDVLTKQELLSTVHQFNTTVTLNDDIKTLNAALAKRKAYIEEEARKGQQGVANEIVLFKAYIDNLFVNLNELIVKLEGIPLASSYVDSLRTTVSELQEYVDGIADVTVEIVRVESGNLSRVISAGMAIVGNEFNAYLAAPPTSFAELQSYISSVADRHAAELAELNKTVFEQVRQSISNEDYEAFLALHSRTGA